MVNSGEETNALIDQFKVIDRRSPRPDAERIFFPFCSPLTTSHGFVWNDYHADRRGILPVNDEFGRRVTFTVRYTSWLKEAHREASMGRRLLHAARDFFK